MVFGSSSSLPSLVSEGGGLVCEAVGKADLLQDHFDSKSMEHFDSKSMESVDLQLTCHQSRSLTTFAFRTSEVRRLLFDLNPYFGTDSLGMFHLFLKRTADVMAPRLNVVFRRLIRLGSFTACWRQANVTPIPTGPSSSSFANYRPISITSVLSKVSDRDVWNAGVLPTTQFAYQKGLGTCDALLCVSLTLQSALESGQEARIVQINFSAVFDRVNHQGILYKLCSVGIGGSVLSILTQFLSNRSQHVMVDGCRNKLVNVVSGVPCRAVFWPVIVPPVHFGAFFYSGK